MVEVLPRSVANRHNKGLIHHHKEGRSNPVTEELATPLNSAEGAVLKLLREVAREKASAMGMARELLARKRDLESCIRIFVESGRLSEHYSGWRAHLVREDFERILARLKL